MKFKSIFVILLCLMLILCFVSCSKDDTDSSSDVQSNTDSEESKPDNEDKPSEDVFYTVSFETGCDTIIEPVSVKKGDKVTAPVEITKNGYSIAGWFVNDQLWSFSDSTVTGDITLSAKWTPNENYLVFNANGGDGSMPNMKIRTDTSASLTLIGFTRAGYDFAGWSTTADGEVEYQDGASYTMGTEASYTIYAVWTPKENTLVFKANGGRGSMSDMTICTDATVNLAQNTFTKEGYKLSGWSTTANGEVEYQNGASYTMGTENSYTLYAVWEIVEYAITYEKNDGIEGAINPVKFTIDDLPFKLNDLSKENYIFCGWYGDRSFTDGPITEITEIGGLTLYAQFVYGTSGLVFKERDGTYAISGYIGTSENVIIPESYMGKAVTAIDSKAFADCTDIKSISLPNSITSIGDNAFRDCASLTSLAIPSDVTEIGAYAFRGCSSLSEIEIPSKITAIGNGLFYNCTSLTSVKLPLGIASIKGDAFRGCSRLTGIDIPADVTEIGAYAFRDCVSLASITIPNSVEAIGAYAFYYCTSLDSITVDTENLCYKSINGSLYTKDEQTLIQYAPGKKDAEFTIPSTVTIIDSSAFEGCAGITSIVIPSSVTAISDYAFANCTNLVSIEIPNTVTKIGWYSFQNCTSLMGVVIPTSVKSIGHYAFQGCTGLISMVIPKGVTSIGSNAFQNCTELAIYCEAESQQNDWSSGWSGSCPVEMGIKSYGQTESGLLWVKTKNEKAIIIDCDKSIFSVSIPSSIDDAEVISIASYVFKNCINLTSVVIPSTVASVGLSEFAGCNSLTIYCEADAQPSGWDSTWNSSKCPVVWDCNNNDVAGDGYIYTVINGIRYKLKDTTAEVTRQSASIKTADIPTTVTYKEQEYNVTKINGSAFYNCTGLTTVKIPSSIISIGNTVFYNCISLTDISVDENNKNHKSVDGSLYSKNGKTFMQYALGKADTEFVMPSTVTTINGFAFYGNSNLTSITISTAMTSIGSNAFYGCKGLVSVTIPDGVTKIGDSAFRDCFSLESVTMPNSVKTIENHAFRNCTSLSSVVISSITTKIGDSAFRDCISLESVVMPNSVTSIENNAFRGCSSLTSVTISTSATKIGDSAFRDCISLESVVIPSSVTNINGSAFYGCTKLASVVISNGVASIGGSAFRYCTSLKSIIIPSSVTKISDSAFRDCSKLTIYCEVDSKPGDWHGNWNYSKCEVVWGYKEEQAN